MIMAIVINWDSPLYNTIMFKFAGDWTWIALRNQIRTAFVLMQKAPSATDLIFDLTAANGLPINSVENLSSLSHHLPANLGTLTLIVPTQAMYDGLLPVCEYYAAAGLRMELALMEAAEISNLASPAIA
jgi:hypothetical protein